VCGIPNGNIWPKISVAMFCSSSSERRNKCSHREYVNYHKLYVKFSSYANQEQGERAYKILETASLY
jgi:hypothetical protein